eukprot:TRINITY_DN12272_c0_g1_i1.p1 TRINITY_DN12272_c0_g1~~TRINITY_DN12272_c0_g1_i1.p1  ORF type:complete len:511 (-),score=91.05 TRINITY_DN12272_c0_g1_i1:169-1701(-)
MVAPTMPSSGGEKISKSENGLVGPGNLYPVIEETQMGEKGNEAKPAAQKAPCDVCAERSSAVTALQKEAQLFRDRLGIVTQENGTLKTKLHQLEQQMERKEMDRLRQQLLRNISYVDTGSWTETTSKAQLLDQVAVLGDELKELKAERESLLKRVDHLTGVVFSQKRQIEEQQQAMVCRTSCCHSHYSGWYPGMETMTPPQYLIDSFSASADFDPRKRGSWPISPQRCMSDGQMNMRQGASPGPQDELTPAQLWGSPQHSSRSPNPNGTPENPDKLMASGGISPVPSWQPLVSTSRGSSAVKGAFATYLKSGMSGAVDNSRGNNLTKHLSSLKKHGLVTEQEIVAACLEKCLELLASEFAVLSQESPSVLPGQDPKQLNLGANAAAAAAKYEMVLLQSEVPEEVASLMAWLVMHGWVPAPTLQVLVENIPEASLRRAVVMEFLRAVFVKLGRNAVVGVVREMPNLDLALMSGPDHHVPHLRDLLSSKLLTSMTNSSEYAVVWKRWWILGA